MTRRLLLATALALIAALAGPAAAGGLEPGPFVAGVEDLPLMAGLAEDPDAAVIYDKPEGRIVEAVARGDVAPAAVERFYRQTLAQLGWAAEEGALSFRREGERLDIAIRRDDGVTVVRFHLAPAG